MRHLFSLASCAMLGLLIATQAHAVFKIEILGLSVSYSGSDALVFWSSEDLTLRVWLPTENDGSLKMSTKDCSLLPTQWVDVVILAPGSLKSLSVKGTPDCEFYVAGNVGHVEKLSLSSGHVGGLACYPDEFGLYSYSGQVPRAVSIKNGRAFGSVLGTPISFPDNQCLL